MALSIRSVQGLVEQRMRADRDMQGSAASYHDELLGVSSELASRPELLAIALDELVTECAQARRFARAVASEGSMLLVDGDAKTGPYRA